MLDLIIKKYWPVLCLVFLPLCLLACNKPTGSAVVVTERLLQTTEVLASVKASNPSGFSRKDQVITVPMTHLGLKQGADVSTFRFIREGAVVPHQFIDRDADGTLDSALIMLDFAAAEDVVVNMHSIDPAEREANSKRSHAEISIKTGGYWQEEKYVGGEFTGVNSVLLPEQYTDHSEYIRYEGPGIESELIGYRIYLDWRNGFDIFGKKQLGMQLKNIGLDGYEGYHEPVDWGMDILKVGKSVGLGGFGFWENNAITRVSDVNSRSARVIEDGDVYSSMVIEYDGWKVGESKVDVAAQFSMIAGSHAVKSRLLVDGDLPQLAIGIVKHSEAALLQGDLDITGRAWSYVATFGPQAVDGTQLVMYVLFQRQLLDEVTADEYNHVLKLQVRGGKLEYYFGAQWGAEARAELSKPAVEAMLQQEVEQLTFAPRVVVNNVATRTKKISLGGAVSAIAWSEMAADSEIQRHGFELAHEQYDTMRLRIANWEYTTGLLTQGVYQLGRATGKQKYTDWAKGIIDSYITDEGEIKTYKQNNYNIDSVNSGKMLLQLFRDTGEEKYRKAASHLRQQLHDHPRLKAGAFWHKKKYPYQLWLDGVYMGLPFLTEYSVMFEGGASLKEVMQEFRVARDFLRDPKTGLYFHAYDEKRVQDWAESETGLSRYFWARGMGWLAMAIVDTYELMPEENTDMRMELAQMAKELADALARYQDGSDVWHQIVDKQGELGNYPESSASAMFTYMLVKGVTTGALSSNYRKAAVDAYNALIKQFVLIDANNSVHLTQACHVGGLGFGRDGSYRYYMSEPIMDNDPKVIGPFLMLGPLVDMLLK